MPKRPAAETEEWGGSYRAWFASLGGTLRSDEPAVPGTDVRVIADLDVHLPGVRAGDGQAFAAWLVGAEPSLRRGLRSFARQVDVEAVLQEALLEPFANDPTGQYRGTFRVSQEVAEEFSLRAHAGGWQISAVCLGDAGVTRAVDAIEKAQQAYPGPGRRHRLEHAQLWNPSLLRRAAELGIVWNSVLALMAGMGRGATLDAWGPERSRYGFPVRSALEHAAWPGDGIPENRCRAAPPQARSRPRPSTSASLTSNRRMYGVWLADVRCLARFCTIPPLTPLTPGRCWNRVESCLAPYIRTSRGFKRLFWS
jgi:hypothetical protein